MSMWTRLFGRSKSSKSMSKPRLGLESLEAREVPAIVFVGGWGSSMYQYAFNDPAADGLPKPPVVDLTLDQKLEVQAASVTDLVLDPFNPDRAADDVIVDGRIITGENFDTAGRARAGWGAGDLINDFVDQDKYVASAKPLPVLLVIADRQDFYPPTGGGDDVLIGGAGVKEFTVTKKTDTSSATGRLEGSGKAFEILSFELGAENTSPATPTGKLYLGTDAGVYSLDTAENLDTAGIAVGGYIRIKKLHSGG